MDKCRETVNRWLQAVGAERGLPLSLDEEGQTCLECDEDTYCLIEVPENAEHFFLYSPMLRLPEGLAEQNAVLKQALSLNLFSIETGGAVLAYDPRSNSVSLTFCEAVEVVEQETFNAMLGGFIELAMETKQRFAHAGTMVSVGKEEPSTVPVNFA
jgi:hypothetical protein